ncbi:hypothetical protein DFH08DRAFT_897038 [Mycena albidolilacea]|uniref:Uncharacterized protein n=1 Tax=Mycena albidolilacea TaxID=1033008 RepID=A0AAD6Z9I0_9AGAR|nr:hypothetical protein DFH08DRAFT_897038 [Mycena albidolilacea]
MAASYGCTYWSGDVYHVLTMSFLCMFPPPISGLVPPPARSRHPCYATPLSALRYSPGRRRMRRHRLRFQSSSKLPQADVNLCFRRSPRAGSAEEDTRMHVGAASRQGRERGGEPKRAARHRAQRGEGRRMGRKDGIREKEQQTCYIYFMHASDCASSAAVARVASASLTKKTKRACRSASEQTDQRRRRGGEAMEVEKEVMEGSRGGGRKVEGEERNERGKADKEGRMYQRVSLPFLCPFSTPYVAVASGSPPYTVDCNSRPTLLPAQIVIHGETSRSGRIGA